jgi:hypothetical protein
MMGANAGTQALFPVRTILPQPPGAVMAMDGIERTAGAPLAQAAAHPAAGVFLHSGWRSCGTWIWERLRAEPGIRGFYEPLHEDLAVLRPRQIGLFRPDSWSSGHGGGAPYFAEFEHLLRKSGGVQGHAARFAFDQFFAGPEQDDPALEAYLRGLIASAEAEGKLPVIKFCRSLGRVAWMEQRFPEMAHAVILRDPGGQWRSARRQMEQARNRYFVLAPFVILARNAEHPLLAEAVARLGVRMPPRIADDLGITVDACWRHVQRLDWRQRFRGFLALWVASGIAALRGQASAIDADRLGGDAAYRLSAEHALGHPAGVSMTLTPDYPRREAADDVAETEAEWEDAARARIAAMGLLDSQGIALAPDRAALLARKLAPQIAVRMRQDEGGHAVLPGVLDYVDAAAYVALARATYPLRRVHYHVRRWLSH